MKTNGYNQWQETGRLLRTKRSPSAKKPIDELPLDELLVLQQRWLKWSPNNSTHPDFQTKQHIYDTYIVPRIKLLQETEQLSKDVETFLL